MPALNNEPLSWQDINQQLLSPRFKKAELTLGSLIFLCSCLFIFMIAMLEAADWGERIEMMLGVGLSAEKRMMFFITGWFVSPLLIGWPFFKLRQLIIQPLLLCQSEYEWVLIQKRTRLLYKATFVIQMVIGFFMTIYAYYFCIA